MKTGKKRWVWVFLVGMILAVATEGFAGEKTIRFAMVVASNRAPKKNMEKLQFADDDAAKNYEFFSSLSDSAYLYTVFDATTQKMFPNLVKKAKPSSLNRLAYTASQIGKKIRKYRKKGYTSEFYLVYSGHGTLLPGKEGAVTLDKGILTRGDLFKKVLKRVNADYTHVIVDACNAYYLVHSKGEWKEDRGEKLDGPVKEFFSDEDLEKYPGLGVVLSTSSEAETHEWGEWSSGIFSHEVRSALTGAADINEDQTVTYSELLAFVDAANLKVKDPKARLNIFARPPARDLNRPLSTIRSSKQLSYLYLPKDLSGRFHLDDDRGVRYADFHKNNEQPLTVGLVPRETYWLRDKRNEYAVTASKGEEVDVSHLESKGMAMTSKGVVADNFKQFLFLQPFGRSFYEGYVAKTSLPSVIEAKEEETKTVASLPKTILKPIRPSMDTAVVFKIKPEREDTELAAILSDLITDQVARLRVVKKLYSHKDIGKMLELAEEKQAVDCESEICYVEISNALGAQKVVSGSIARLGKTRILTLSLADNHSGQVEARAQVTITGSDEDLIPATQLVVQELFANYDVGYLDMTLAPPHSVLEVDGVEDPMAVANSPVALYSGDYELRLMKNGEVLAHEQITVAKGQLIPWPLELFEPEPEVIPEPEESFDSEPEVTQVATQDTGGGSSVMRKAAWGCMVSSLAVLGGGGALTYLALKDRSDWQSDASMSDSVKDRSKQEFWAAQGLYGLGGALLVTSIILFAVDPGPGAADGPALTVMPMAGPNSAAISVSTSW